MRVLILSLCKYKLSEEEYVRPLLEIFSKIANTEVKQYKEKYDPEKYDLIVLSGTALRDFEYLNHLEKFEWIRNTDKKVIGICAGSQIITKLFGGKLIRRRIIGVRKIKSIFGDFNSYFLTSYIPVLNNDFEILGKLEDIPVMFKIKNREIYGFLFHPEVLNSDLFLKITTDNINRFDR